MKISHTNYFPPITCCNRIQLEKKCRGSIFPLEFDHILLELSQRPKSIALLSTSKIGANFCGVDRFDVFCQIFASGRTPKTHESFAEFKVPNLDLLICHKVANCIIFKCFIPLSTSCFDTKFHELQVQPEFIEVVMNALGRRGIFPSRYHSRHHRHSSYLGKRSAKACILPNPSKDPCEYVRWYYCQHINHICWPYKNWIIVWVKQRQGWISISTSILVFYSH